MVNCSKLRKAECITDDCNWLVGKGCRSNLSIFSRASKEDVMMTALKGQNLDMTVATNFYDAIDKFMYQVAKYIFKGKKTNFDVVDILTPMSNKFGEVGKYFINEAQKAVQTGTTRFFTRPLASKIKSMFGKDMTANAVLAFAGGMEYIFFDLSESSAITITINTNSTEKLTDTMLYRVLDDDNDFNELVNTIKYKYTKPAKAAKESPVLSKNNNNPQFFMRNFKPWLLNNSSSRRINNNNSGHNNNTNSRHNNTNNSQNNNNSLPSTIPSIFSDDNKQIVVTDGNPKMKLSSGFLTAADRFLYLLARFIFREGKATYDVADIKAAFKDKSFKDTIMFFDNDGQKAINRGNTSFYSDALGDRIRSLFQVSLTTNAVMYFAAGMEYIVAEVGGNAGLIADGAGVMAVRKSDWDATIRESDELSALAKRIKYVAE